MDWLTYNRLPLSEQRKKSVIERLDARSREVAMRFYHPTDTQKQEAIARRRANQRALDAITQEEINRHCQVPPPPR